MVHTIGRPAAKPPTDFSLPKQPRTEVDWTGEKRSMEPASLESGPGVPRCIAKLCPAELGGIIETGDFEGGVGIEPDVLKFGRRLEAGGAERGTAVETSISETAAAGGVCVCERRFADEARPGEIHRANLTRGQIEVEEVRLRER
jgi:hypothetical protein